MTSAQNDIIAIGSACIDHLSIITRTADGWEDCGAPLVQGGGPAATGSVAISKLGGKVELWAIIGDDRHGQMVKTELDRWGVDVSQMICLPNGRTSSSFIEVDSDTGERMIYGSGFVVQPAEIQMSFDLKRIEGAKSMLVTGSTPIISAEAARLARERGIPVVADLFRVDGPNADIVKHVDALILPEFADVVERAGGDFVKAVYSMAELGGSKPAITVGPKGCYYLAEGKVWHSTAFKIRAVDTTGCGDSFHGAYAYALTQGWDVHECVRFSSAVAGLKATKLGGRTGLPTLVQVKAFMTERNDEARTQVVG